MSASTDKNKETTPDAKKTAAVAAEKEAKTDKHASQPIDGLFTLHPADTKKVGF